MRRRTKADKQDDREALAAELRAWMRRNDYSITSFARRCGIHKQRVHAWVNAEDGAPILLPVVLELLERERLNRNE